MGIDSGSGLTPRAPPPEASTLGCSQSALILTRIPRRAIQFAAGKGHIRVLKYMLDHSGVEVIDEKTARTGICALDRAAKSG